MAVREQQAPARAAAEGSPLDVMLTDAALGPVRRLLPGRAGLKLWARLASRSVDTAHHVAWLAERSGDLKDAPGALGSATHERIGKAPGAYVMEP